ncbi:MAG: cellulase family glycosylhydrolase [bacterium]
MNRWIRVFCMAGLLILEVHAPVFARAAIGIHKSNFFMLGRGEEVFYPLAVNASGLMDPSLTEAEMEPVFARWADHHVNTLRIVIDRAFGPGDPLNTYMNRDGRLGEAILTRLDAIFTLAEKYQIYVILALFDTQRMAEHWNESPSNLKNGGECKTLAEWFTKPYSLGQALKRVQQLADRFKSRNVLAWEIARGANVWDLDPGPELELRDGVVFWVVRVASALREADDQGHLTAISFLPNTYPTTLLNLPQVQVNLLPVESQDPLLAARSVPRFIQSLRDFKKPVFIVEPLWVGSSGNRESFMQYVFWSSFAAGGGMFLSPQLINQREQIGDADLSLLDMLAAFLPEIRLDGVPRPITAPLEMTPMDTYLSAESLAGYDRIFWFLRKKPAKEKAQLLMRTVEGIYQYQWFDLETGMKYPPNTFRQFRKELRMETPEFERDILGVLRLREFLPPPKPTDTAAPGK